MKQPTNNRCQFNKYAQTGTNLQVSLTLNKNGSAGQSVDLISPKNIGRNGYTRGFADKGRRIREARSSC
jgi:hypothetical protein